MNGLRVHQDLCRQFAVLLTYPDKSVEDHASACIKTMRTLDSDAAACLETFLRFTGTNDFCRIEEAFTGTFDLQSLCHPYVGYQLCGESRQRTLFMLKLSEIYRQFDFTPGRELPDHLAEMLRFLGSISDQECRREIIQDGILPALMKITQQLESDENPYQALLKSLQYFLTSSLTENVWWHADRQKERVS